MSGLNIQNSRITLKYSTLTGDTPTIAPSLDHTDGTWNANDIYIGEVMINVATDAMWFRSLNGIIPITSGTTTIDSTAFLNTSGGTLTGPLFGPSISATTISATTFYSPSFNGTFFGDGSNLTGITATVFTGGTISGPTIFTNNVDLCGAVVTIESLSGCGGTSIQFFSSIDAVGHSISATTFFGDGSGLTNLPYMSGVTLQEVLDLGDTSTNGSIVLQNGNIILDSGTFFGDGAGLTNIPFGPTPTLEDVLLIGNVSTNSSILLTNGSIVLDNGIFYGDGSGLSGLTVTADFTGGTVTGSTNFTNGITATTISATTYLNLPTAETLQQTLVAGNTTGNNWIESSNLYGMRSVNGLDDRRFTFNPDAINISATDDIGNGEIEINNSGVITLYSSSGFYHTLEDGGGSNADFVIRGYTGFKGAEYFADYSADYTNRSLVDKGYVDSNISAITFLQDSGTTRNSIIKVDSNGNATGTKVANNATPTTYSESIFSDDFYQLKTTDVDFTTIFGVAAGGINIECKNTTTLDESAVYINTNKIETFLWNAETTKSGYYQIIKELSSATQTVGVSIQESIGATSVYKFSRSILQNASTTNILLFSTRLGAGIPSDNLVFVEIKLMGSNLSDGNKVYMGDIKQGLRWLGNTPTLIGTAISSVFSTTEAGTKFSLTTDATHLILNVDNAELSSAQMDWSAHITLTLKLKL